MTDFNNFIGNLVESKDLGSCPNLKLACNHSSLVFKDVQTAEQSNQRLEFLGDAVLDLIISEYLMRQYPKLNEGELSKCRAFVVNARSLSFATRTIEMGKYLKLSKGEELSGGREKNSILADFFEAVVGALYLDCGLEMARKFVHASLKDKIADATQHFESKDYKSLLQEWTQKNIETLPTYTIRSENGPDHSKEFEVEVEVAAEDKSWHALGKGSSKKRAEQEGARKLLEKVLKGKNHDIA